MAAVEVVYEDEEVVVVVANGSGGGGKPRTVTFKIDEESLSLLDAAARRLRISRSELIRRAILAEARCILGLG